jgi:hypothetical protein
VDRLFAASAWVLRLPELSGPSAVGTTPLLLEDPSRGSAERRVALRLWYPALASGAQPAGYFLDEREARVNATNNGLPPTCSIACMARAAWTRRWMSPSAGPCC